MRGRGRRRNAGRRLVRGGRTPAPAVSNTADSTHTTADSTILTADRG